MPLRPPPWPRWLRITIGLAIAPLVGLLIGAINGRPMFGTVLLAACAALATAISEWQRHGDRKRLERRIARDSR